MRFLSIAAAMLIWSAGVFAQAYPAKPIRLIAPYPPGGGTDFFARLVGAKMSEHIGQPIVVENRPGASSIIAAQYVAQAAPDGYTIFSAEQGALVFNAALYSKLSYDPQRDFATVCDMTRRKLVLGMARIELLERNSLQNSSIASGDPVVEPAQTATLPEASVSIGKSCGRRSVPILQLRPTLRLSGKQVRLPTSVIPESNLVGSCLFGVISSP